MNVRAMNWSTICNLILIALTCVQSKLEKVRLDDSGNFVDANGRMMLFRGFNAVQKGPPWYPFQMLNRTQLKMFQNWGLNFVRLGVMWSGVMPEKHQVNETYMATIEAIIDVCAEYGIYLLLDMHQDAVSSRFGTYDGVPRWLVDELCHAPVSVAYPWPYEIAPTTEFENYFTYACADCATKLYQNISGAWTYWGEFWSVVAKRFGKKSNVIGFELINEPPPPNFYESLFSAVPGIAGRQYLMPVYDYLVEQIRKYDTDTLIFYEPLTYAVFLPDSKYETGTGFDRVPGALLNPNAYKTSVLSYHYYCWPLQTANTSRNMSFQLQVFCDALLLPSVIVNSEMCIRRTGGGRFMTEFGVCVPDGNPLSVNTIECAAVLSMADTTFQSWAYWDTNFLDDDGNPIPEQVKLFIRTYPQRTLGIPHDLKFDTASGRFTYTFLYHGPKSSSDVEVAVIFVPEAVHYPGGVQVTVNPNLVQHTLAENQLRLTVPAAFTDRSIHIMVRIRAA